MAADAKTRKRKSREKLSNDPLKRGRFLEKERERDKKRRQKIKKTPDEQSDGVKRLSSAGKTEERKYRLKQKQQIPSRIRSRKPNFYWLFAYRIYRIEICKDVGYFCISLIVVVKMKFV
jgi:hypothetical protein